MATTLIAPTKTHSSPATSSSTASGSPPPEDLRHHQSGHRRMLRQVAEAGADDVDRAVAAARTAFERPAGAWRAMPPASAAACLEARRAGREASTSSPSSRRWTTASRSSSRAKSTCRWRRRPPLLRGWADKIHGETVNTFDNAFTYTLREPVGVVGAITRGTSRCCWPRGRSHPRWPAATPWSSSPPRRRR